MRNSHRFSFGMSVGVCFTLMAFPSLGQIKPFGFGTSRSEPRLSGTDLDLLRDSVDRLNRNPKPEVGSQDQWANPATGSHGKSVITRTFTSAGRPCHAMHHELFLFGQTAPKAYDLTWCRVSDGQWKIKS
jgi:hypothetical protein